MRSRYTLEKEKTHVACNFFSLQFDYHKGPESDVQGVHPHGGTLDRSSVDEKNSFSLFSSSFGIQGAGMASSQACIKA